MERQTKIPEAIKGWIYDGLEDRIKEINFELKRIQGMRAMLDRKMDILQVEKKNIQTIMLGDTEVR